MKEAACRICARELCGNQRRWIFHASTKLNLQVLLSHAIGCELTRDGRGEFICSKCTFMLERMYRFDTVVARVEALSLERLQRLLLEKERLRQCISGMYHRNNLEDGPGGDPPTQDPLVADLSALRYSDMIQDDLALSVYESWADRDDPGLDRHQHQCTMVAESVTGQKPRRCRGCAALRVADSDYEAVCKVPRRIGRRSTSCGPPTRGDDPVGPTEGDELGGPRTWGDDSGRASEAATVTLELPQTGMETDKPTCEKRSPSPGSSVDSLGPEETQPGQDTLWDKLPTDSSFSTLKTTLGLLRGGEYRPVKTHRGSKLPVLVKSKLDLGLCGGTLDQDLDPPQVMVVAPEVEFADMEEEWLDEYVRCGPFRFQQVDRKPRRESMLVLASSRHGNDDQLRSPDFRGQY